MISDLGLVLYRREGPSDCKKGNGLGETNNYSKSRTTLSERHSTRELDPTPASLSYSGKPYGRCFIGIRLVLGVGTTIHVKLQTQNLPFRSVCLWLGGRGMENIGSPSVLN